MVDGLTDGFFREVRLPVSARIAKKWRVLQVDSRRIEALKGNGGQAVSELAEVILAMLANRGLREATDVRRFLDPKPSDLHPPGLLPGVETVVNRLMLACQNQEEIVLHGDYDTDGCTGTSILLLALRHMGAKVRFHIPNRTRDGYGLKPSDVEEHAKTGTRVIVTIDCGITAVAASQKARELGLSLLITDHHQPGPELPQAEGLVHPGLPGTSYPFGQLCGAGVAFKVAWALAMKACGGEKVDDAWRGILLQGLALAALGTVADHMPLLDENRALVRCGLKNVGGLGNPGLSALMEVAQIEGETRLRSEDIAFKLAPRLNAAGRMDCARMVVELFTTKQNGPARSIAQMLDKYNKSRQTVEREVLEAANLQVEELGLANRPVMVLWGKGWHPGVVGIVASRLVDAWHRPVFIAAVPPFSDAAGEADSQDVEDSSCVALGSARGSGGFPLPESLAAVSDLLKSHGGHRAAAGFKLDPENLPNFRDRLEKAGEAFFGATVPRPTLRLDAEIPLQGLGEGLIRDLNRLEPYGNTNRKPLFLASGLEIEGEPRIVGKDGRHLQVVLRQGPKKVRAVAFRMADRLEELKSGGGALSIAFRPEINTFMGRREIQIHIEDFQPQANPDVEFVSSEDYWKEE
jgi:single-stranded-DNA-specific exonuclease